MWTKIRRREERDFYLFILPWLVGFVAFIAGPLLFSFVISTFRWMPLIVPKWIGLANFVEIFTDDPLFWKVARNTFYYMLGSVPLSLGMSLVVALLLSRRKFFGRNFYRAAFYMPGVVSGVAIAVVWAWIYNPSFGIINALLANVGIQGPQWLWSDQWAMPSLIFMSVWWMGQNMIIYIAGIESIPQQLYEVASLDGASRLQRFTAVTLPMLSPVLIFTLIISIIYSFQIFVQTYIMTQGGPNDATRTWVLYIYNKGFQDFRMGYASTIGVLLFAVVAILSLTAFVVSKRWVYYESRK